jgi:hypothetical protein
MCTFNTFFFRKRLKTYVIDCDQAGNWCCVHEMQLTNQGGRVTNQGRDSKQE